MYITADSDVLAPFCSMQFTTLIAFALAVAHVGVATAGASTLEARQASCAGLVFCTPGDTTCGAGSTCTAIGTVPVLGCEVGVRTQLNQR